MKTEYLVTFRNSTDKLTSMFTEKFATVKAAKAAIECDAACFINCHKYHGGPVGLKFRQKSGWVKPKTEDYFEVRGQDGTRCVWQYFKVA